MTGFWYCFQFFDNIFWIENSANIGIFAEEVTIVAVTQNNDSAMQNLIVEYVGDLGTAIARGAAASEVTRYIVNSFGNRQALEKARAGGKNATRVAVVSLLTQLQNDGRMSPEASEMARRGLIEFIDEYFRALPSGDPSATSLLNSYRSATKKVYAFLSRNPDPEDPKDASMYVRKDVITDEVLAQIRQMATSDKEFEGWLRVRSHAMHLLYLSAHAGGPEAIDANIAFDQCFFGDVSSNLLFVQAVMGARDNDEVVEKGIASALNNTEKNFTVLRAELALVGVAHDVLHAIKGTVLSFGNMFENRLVPYAKLLTSFELKVQAGSWVAYVISVMLFLWAWAHWNPLLGFAGVIVAFTAMIVPFTVSIMVVNLHMSFVRSFSHALQMIMSGIPLLKIDKPRSAPMRDMDNPDELTTTENLLRVFRWRAILPLFTMQSIFGAIDVVFIEEGLFAPVDWFSFVLNLLMMGLTLTVLIKFEAQSQIDSGTRLIQSTRWMLGAVYVVAIAFIVLGHGNQMSPRDTAIATQLIVEQKAVDVVAYSTFQIVTILAIVAMGIVGTFLILALREKDGRLKTAMAMMAIVIVTMVLGAILDHSIEKHPPMQEAPELASWKNNGLENPLEFRKIRSTATSEDGGEKTVEEEDEGDRLIRELEQSARMRREL